MHHSGDCPVMKLASWPGGSSEVLSVLSVDSGGVNSAARGSLLRAVCLRCRYQGFRGSQLPYYHEMIRLPRKNGMK